MNKHNKGAYTVLGCAVVVFGVLAGAYPTSVNNAGDVCKPRSIFCADGDGTSSRYLKCVHERLVEGFCPQDSICVGSKDTTIFCATDRPSSTLNKSPSAVSPEETTLTVIVHQTESAQALAPKPLPPAVHSSPKPPILLLASKTSAQQQLMVPTLPAIALPQASPVSSPILTNHYPLNGGQKLQDQPLLLHQPPPSSIIQAVHQQPWNPTSQAIQDRSKPHSPPFFAVSGSPNSNKAQGPSSYVPSLYPGIAQHIAPTTLPPTQHRHNSQQIQPQESRPQSPHALAGLPNTPQQGNDGFKPKPTQALFGGIEADRVLSVVGSAIFSQLALSTEADTEVQSAGVVSHASKPLSLSLEPSKAKAIETSIVSQSASVANEPTSIIPMINMPPPLAPPPMLPPPPPVCNPGNFMCAMHGLGPGYFACDAAGVALPASCAEYEVCYQYGQSIICAAPGEAPRPNMF